MPDDFDVIDVEDYAAGGGDGFSKTSLIMKTANKCIDAGAKEKKKDFRTEKMDRLGNLTVVSDEDTRKTYMECIQTFYDVLAADFDEEFNDAYENIIKNIRKEFERLCKVEKQEYLDATPQVKQIWFKEDKYYYREGMMHESKPFLDEFYEFKIEKYRELFRELIKLAKRCDYWRDQLLKG